MTLRMMANSQGTEDAVQHAAIAAEARAHGVVVTAGSAIIWNITALR